jgi:hypothetical protein
MNRVALIKPGLSMNSLILGKITHWFREILEIKHPAGLF